MLINVGKLKSIKKAGSAAPIISNIVQTIVDPLYAVVTWNTDKPTNSAIAWDHSPSVGYTQNNISPTLTTSHSLVMGLNSNGTGGNQLNENTLYNFKVGNYSGFAFVVSSPNQTLTTPFLYLPNVGPFASHAPVKVDDTTDFTDGGTVETSPASPLIANTLEPFSSLSSDGAGVFDLYTWANLLTFGSVGCEVTMDALGNPGEDGTAEFICPESSMGGVGGAGSSGGGGGSAFTGGCGGALGGAGGMAGGNGEDGESQNICCIIGTGGGGGIGIGFLYDGANVGLSLVPGNGGNGADTGQENQKSPQGGGGGGGAGGLNCNVSNQIASVGNAYINATGGSGGNGVAPCCCGAGPQGNAGDNGTAVFMARKYDGSLLLGNINNFYGIEIVGPQAGPNTFIIHTNSTDTWDHLYQP